MSRETERAVVGAALIDPSAYWRVADLTKAEHFSDPRLRQLWAFIAEGFRDGQTVDPVILAERFGSLPTDLAAESFSTANVRAYAAKLADTATGVAVTLAGKRIAALDGTGVDRLASASQILREIEVGGRPIKTVRDVMAPVFERMRSDCASNKPVQGIPYGWGHLDAMTSGLHPGQLVIVAGRPSMGKSVFATQLAMQVGMAGNGVHFATLEMTADECLQRMLAAEGQIPFASVRNAPRLEDHEWTRLTGASATLAGCPIKFDDEAYALDDILARIRQHAMADGLGLAVIDYLGYIDLPKAERHDLAIQATTRALKRLAKDLAIPVVLVAQLNREVGTRANHRPVLSDLRDSGAIEQDADVVILLHRDDYYDPKCASAGFAEAIIAKQRNGPTGSCAMRHRFDVMRFDEAEGMPNVEAERPTGFARRTRGNTAAEVRAGAF